MKRLSTASKTRILLIQGSPRDKENCPGQSGKTLLLAEHLLNYAPQDIEIDYLDLSVKVDKSVVQPCKACISTAGGFHCHFPCDCYQADSKESPDLMHDEDVYRRLQEADGFMVLTPVHWYSTTSQVKAMFDRLVCTNLTLTVEQAEALGIGKDPVKSRELEQGGEYTHLLSNHLMGKWAAFFIHGDSGGGDYAEFSDDPDAGQKKLPDSYLMHAASDLTEGWVNDPRNSVMGLVWQCRYSGIYVPDDLILGWHATSGLKYSEAMDLAIDDLDYFYQAGLDLLKKLRNYIRSGLL